MVSSAAGTLRADWSVWQAILRELMNNSLSPGSRQILAICITFLQFLVFWLISMRNFIIHAV
ncbi:MAG: hypothetical protein GY927_14845 [bacterium]|nr:hypothetical protein [bacterium]